MVTVKNASEKYGKLFYMTYCIDFQWDGSGDNFIRAFKRDIINLEELGVLTSPNHAQVNGKPLIGFGFAEHAEWQHPEAMYTIIRWVKDRGYAVKGFPMNNDWARSTGLRRDIVLMFDMVSPWTVGRFSSKSDMERWYRRYLEPDIAFGREHNIKVLPPIWSGGGGWSNLGNAGKPDPYSRRAGQFFWDQAYLLKKNYDIDTVLIAVLDEVDESTAIYKTAVDYFDIPTDNYFLTNASSGWWLSSDFYLRTVGALLEMMRGTRALTPDIDVPHSMGPIFWRNSFEMRDGREGINDNHHGQGDSRATRWVRVPNIRMDVCLNNPAILTNKGRGVSLTTNDILRTSGKSGEHVFHLAGSGNGSVYYKIADVKINTDEALELIYSIRPLNEAGRGVFVDLLFSDGSLLSENIDGVIEPRGATGGWTDVKISVPAHLASRGISGVVAGFSGSGNFSAYLDDIILQAYNEPTAGEPAEAPNLNTAASWARDGINGAFNKGFIPAELQNNYQNIITRAEFCRLAVKWVEYASGKSIDALLSERGLSRDLNSFTDTDDPDILAAHALDIISGAGNNLFNPGGQFTREQAAVMIMNACRVIGADIGSHPAATFADMNNAAGWALNGIGFVQANGIMTGTGGNSFNPQGVYTRQESIVTFDNIKGF
jgi:hypothetical protein